MNRAQTWVVGKMTVWHEGPNGGQCPSAGTDRECSQAGIGAVRRYGALAGTLVAAWTVAHCQAGPEDDDPCPIKFEKSDPGRWAFQLLLIPFLGLHLREALPSPQPGSCPFLVFGLLLLSVGGNGSPWPGQQEPSSNPFCSRIALSALLGGDR